MSSFCLYEDTSKSFKSYKNSSFETFLIISEVNGHIKIYDLKAMMDVFTISNIGELPTVLLDSQSCSQNAGLVKMNDIIVSSLGTHIKTPFLIVTN